MKNVVIKTMDKTGDSRQSFDLDDPKSKADAEKALADIQKKAAVVVTVPGAGVQGEVVRSVEQLAEENVVIPAITGG